MTVLDALKLIERTKFPGEIFADHAKPTYHNLLKLVHPDKVPERLRVRAEAACAKLTRLYSENSGKANSTNPIVIGKWLVAELLAAGDICDLYHSERTTDSAKGIFKIARSEDDSDLLEQEYFALQYLATGDRGRSYGGNFLKYLPRIIERIEASGRSANVLIPAMGRTLADIATFYPNSSLDFRHVVWMANRGLSALGFVHECGIFHGAVTPGHLLYDTESHGLTLLDWCYSVTVESRKCIPAVVKVNENLYPAEVIRKNPPLPGTDIFMLLASLRPMAHIPKRFRALFDWCMAASARSRPESAWEVQNRWTALAREEYGDPAFVRLEIRAS